MIKTVTLLFADVLSNSGVPDHLVRSTIRLSVGRYTSKEDIDIVVCDLEKALLPLL